MFRPARSTTILAAALALQLALSPLTAAWSDVVIVTEIEGLLTDLPSTDSSVPALKLKLADLLFSDANDYQSKLDATAEEKRLISPYRQKAVALYREVLDGKDGHPALTGEVRVKAQFQLARLAVLLEEPAEAKRLWETLHAQDIVLPIQHEAAMQLAELNEVDNATPAMLAQADQYYRKALSVCPGEATPSLRVLKEDSCIYAHYRRGWLLYNRGTYLEAVAEMEKSLVDSKGRVREEALRDLVLFWSGKPTQGQDDVTNAIARVEKVSKQVSRPKMIADLAEGYFAAGNKVAGTQVLALVAARAPRMPDQIRLLEEFYGMRDWAKFRSTLSDLSVAATKTASPSKSKASLSPTGDEEKILRRLLVQLDGERISSPEYASDFKSTTLLYLALFPKSAERAKMVDGWIAAEDDDANKIIQLKKWIAESGSDTSEIARLRKIRAAAAQKKGDHQIVADEMAILVAAEKDPAKKREYQYLQARSLYELKANDKALKLFKSLAQVAPGQSPDPWAIQSQHLALDVLNQAKAYPALVAQAATWTSNPALAATLGKDLEEMKTVSDEAVFQDAIAAGERKSSLATFQSFCALGKFLPKSCENAKLLAVKLKDQEALLAVLETTAATQELTSELEASARFDRAAAMLEARKEPKGFTDLMKIALLFELSGKTQERDRVLNEVLAQRKKAKPLSDGEEALLIATLKDAGMLSSDKLAILSAKAQLRVAGDLELSGQGDDKMRAMLLKSADYAGPAWAKLVLEQVHALDAEQRKIAFYGRKSEADFKRRMSALTKLVDKSDHYLPGSDPRTRAEIAAIVAKAQRDLAQEIVSTPLPVDLEPAAVDEIRASLATMSAPFIEKAEAYEGLAQQQLAKLEAETQPAPQAVVTPRKMDAKVRELALADLSKDPTNRVAVVKLKAFHESNAQLRLAAYFEGRLKAMDTNGGTQQ